MLSARVLRSVARGAPRRCPAHRILARGFASTPAAFRSESGKTALGQKGANKTPSSIDPKKSLLAEAELTTTEQRKADWGIIKEMSRYLWPKVGVSFCLPPPTPNSCQAGAETRRMI